MMTFVLVALLCLVILAVGWWVSGPMGAVWRWLFRGVLMVLLAGMALPADAVLEVKKFVAALAPALQDIEPGGGTSIAVHLVLFMLTSALLFIFRHDLRWQHLLAGLVALAFVTEGVQLLVDGRYASWADVGVNLLGVAIGTAGRWVR